MDKPLPDDFDPNILPVGASMSAYSGGSGNDGNGKQWLMQLLQGLILAGIVALIGVTWSVSSSVTELRVTLSEREKQNDRDIARLESADARHDADIRGIDGRVTELEREQSSSEPYANHRQKR